MNKPDVLKAIATLHMIAYSSNKPASDVGAEVLFAVGDLLEGVPLEELDLKVIDKADLLRELQNGRISTNRSSSPSHLNVPSGSAGRQPGSEGRCAVGRQVRSVVQADVAGKSGTRDELGEAQDDLV